MATKTRLTGLGRPPVELDAEGRLVALRQKAYWRDAKNPNDFKYVFSGQPAYPVPSAKPIDWGFRRRSVSPDPPVPLAT